MLGPQSYYLTQQTAPLWWHLSWLGLLILGKNIICIIMTLVWGMSTVFYVTLSSKQWTQICLPCSDTILNNHFMSRIIRCPKYGHHHKQTNLMLLNSSCNITDNNIPILQSIQCYSVKLSINRYSMLSATHMLNLSLTWII